MHSVSSKSPVASSLALILIAVAVYPSGAIAQQASPSQQEVQQAFQLIRQGEAEAAITSLQTLVESQPDFAPAWNALGVAHRSLQQYDASLTAYQRVVELTPEVPGAIYQLGIAEALSGNVDTAFQHLSSANESGRIDITNLLVSPAAAVLQADPRWATLLPTEEEFAAPFVEDTAILKEWRGEGPRDVFGWIARNIGDVDGDGIDDFTTSSNGQVETGSNNGKVYTYSTGTGELLWSVTGTVPQGRLGQGIEAAGDVNGDGIPDVVAGAPYAGEAYVYSGIDGAALHHFESPDKTGAFGGSVRGIGDLDGDGFGDILVGEPYQMWGGPVNGGDINVPGRAYIFSGNDGSLLMKLVGGAPGDGFGANVHGATIGGTTWFMVGAPGTEGGGVAYVYKGFSSIPHFVARPDEGASQFGAMFMSVFGDASGDGTPDMYIADWSHNEDGAASGEGKFYVFSGADGERLFDMVGEAPGDGLGIGESVASDVNGDGAADLVVAAWQHGSAAASGGKVYVVSGSDGSVLWTITGRVPGETLGFDTTQIGDVDGDGHVDFLLTSAYSAVNGWHSGRVIVVSGAPPAR